MAALTAVAALAAAAGAWWVLLRQSSSPAVVRTQVEAARWVRSLQDNQMLIPTGRYRVGAQATDPAAPGYDPAAASDEVPFHEIELSAYLIDAREVTAASALKCVEVGACDEAGVTQAPGFFNVGVAGHAGHPANGVSWWFASQYCAWRGGRLPTEAEWEVAARGPEAHRFPTADIDPCEWSIFRDPTGSGNGLVGGTARLKLGAGTGTGVQLCSYPSTIAVDYMADWSAFGVTGLTSNVAEWVADWYDEAAYRDGVTKDPAGPGAGTAKVVRGGSWLDERPEDLRASARGRLAPEQQQDDVGFRCAYAPDWKPRPEGPAEAATVGPFRRGQDLGGGWTIKALRLGRDMVTVRVEDGAGNGADLLLAPPAGAKSEDVSLGHDALVYRASTVPYESLEVPGAAVSRLAREAFEAAAPEDAVRRWVSEAETVR